MRRAVFSIAVGLLLSASASTALGLGLGRGINTSTLGQPLNFSVPVSADVEEILAPECLAAEVFAGDVRLQAPAVRVSLEPGADPTQATVRVVTTSGIDEPVVTVSVGVGCPQRVSRRFVLFVDPPLVAFAPTVAADPAVKPPVRAEARPSAVTSAGPPVPGANARAPVRRAGRPGRGPLTSATAVVVQDSNASTVPAAGQKRKPPAARASNNASAKPASSPAAARLKLEPALALATASVAAASAAAAALPAAPAATAEPAASAADSARAPPEADPQASQRVVALEESLAKLNAEAKATRGSLEVLQTRLREADAARASNPMVWALGLLSAALTVAVLFLLRRQARSRADAAWWAASGGALAEPAVPPEPSEQAETGPMRMASVVIDSGFSSSPFTRSMHETFTVAAAPTATEPVEEATRELSVEELIDLEQQADFFIVLGQDEAAIDLLMNHVRSTGGVSPMPYIKLLEIYRRRGDQDSYERIRGRFNRRFNAEVPGSEADPEHGRSIDDYPEILSALLLVWPLPAQAVEQISLWLARSGTSSPSFDLPAYAELIFLHAVARDLAECETHPGGIDVLLPLTDGDASSISTLTATMPLEPAPASAATTYDLDLDLSLPAAAAADDRDGVNSDFISLGDDSRSRG